MRILMIYFICLLLVPCAIAQDLQPGPSANLAIWPDLAPGELSRETGTNLPPRNKATKLPVTRVEKICKPTMDVFPAANPNGVGVLILPGGGFNYVVPDLEGSDVAPILNKLGISVFVLRYRTRKDKNDTGWKSALQDSQRAMKFLRKNADKWKLETSKIGLLGFSAGGQVAARLLTDKGEIAYQAIDEVDKLSHRPDFSIMIYPWNMYDEKTGSLLPELKIDKTLPPTFIVHTSDDRSSSLGSVYFYAGLKKAGVDAELHVYRNGGHGYGTRPRSHSSIGTWPDRMVDWIKSSKITSVDSQQ